MFIRMVSFLLLCSLVGCGGSGGSGSTDRYARAQSAVTTYVVRPGDTLYSIAFRYGLDYRKVAEVNRIVDPYTIYPGQSIYLWRVASSSVIPAAVPAVATAPIVLPSPVLSSKAAPVKVTPVPEVAAAPVSEVARPSTPVYQGRPPVATGINRDAAGVPPPPVDIPAIETPPITGQPPASDTYGGSGAVPVAAPVPVVAAAPGRKPNPGGKVTSWRWPASGGVTRSYSASLHKGIDIGGSRGEPIYAVADGIVVYAGTGIVGYGELVIVKHNDIYISAYGHNDRLLVKENDVVGAGQLIAEKGSSGTDTVKLHFEIREQGQPIDPLKLLPRR